MNRWLQTGSLSDKRKLVDNENPTQPNKIIKTTDVITQEVVETKKWPSVWNDCQWFEFKEKYPWIICSNGKLKCKTCSSIHA